MAQNDGADRCIGAAGDTCNAGVRIRTVPTAASQAFTIDAPRIGKGMRSPDDGNDFRRRFASRPPHPDNVELHVSGFPEA
jgi:hypothetical protein